ncbi:MAG: amidohydrolase family protein [Xanthobacteraceae bacterium]|nr:amidohydrolase family protein [Xanthobacteraceae bacterium]
MRFFDFRVRPPYKGFLSMVMYAQPERRNGFTRNLKFEPSPAADKQSVELMIDEMNQAGVEKALVVGRNSGMLGSIDNAEVAEFCNMHPGRFLAAASIDASERKRAVQQIDDAIKAGFRIVNIEPGAYVPAMFTDDRRLYPIYAHCEDRNIPIIVMTGGNAGPDLNYTHPALLDRVLADFPKLKIVCSHGNWPWVTEILHVAFRRSNLYVSPDMYLPNMPGSDDYVKAADGFLQDRLIYASSFPFCGIKEYAEWFSRLPIRPEAMEKVAYRNAMTLLGLS